MSPAIFCRSAPATVDKNPLYEALACRRKIHSVYLQKRQSYSIRKPSKYYYLEEAGCCCVRATMSKAIPVLLFLQSPGESHRYEGQYKNQFEETGCFFCVFYATGTLQLRKLLCVIIRLSAHGLDELCS